MAWVTIRYSVGNEHDPGDPWGRSELVIHTDGSARLDHYFSRGRQPRAWAGHVDAAVPPAGPLPPGTAPRRLTVEADGTARQAIVSWHRAPSLPGYAEAFDLLDAVIRQLSGDAVPYPAERGPVVHGAEPVRP